MPFFKEYQLLFLFVKKTTAIQLHKVNKELKSRIFLSRGETNQVTKRQNDGNPRKIANV